MEIRFNPPPKPIGTPEERLAALERWAAELCERLNIAADAQEDKKNDK